MTEAGTLCTNGDVEKKSGLNGNSTADAEAYTNVYIKMAEGFICGKCRYNFVGNYASLSTIGKEFLRNLTSSLAAIMVINYDMSGYTSRTESQTMLDINYTIVVDSLNELNDDKIRSFIISGSP